MKKILQHNFRAFSGNKPTQYQKKMMQSALPYYGVSYYIGTTNNAGTLHIHIDFASQFNRDDNQYHSHGERIYLNYEVPHSGFRNSNNYYPEVGIGQLSTLFSNPEEIHREIYRLQSEAREGFRAKCFKR